ALADRSEAQAAPPPTAGAVSSLVPLPEILCELTASGTASRTVARGYDQAIAKLGPELSILQSVPVEDIAHAGSSLLAEAITRLRSGHVIRDAGYDGEYGVISLFEENEIKRLTGGALLFETPVSKRKPTVPRAAPTAEAGAADAASPKASVEAAAPPRAPRPPPGVRVTRPPSRRDRGCESFQIAPAAPRPASSRSSMTISAPQP